MVSCYFDIFTHEAAADEIAVETVVFFRAKRQVIRNLGTGD